MDRFDAMRMFVRVVQSGGFSATAREVGVGQPFVSKQIAQLEAHLGEGRGADADGSRAIIL